MCTHACLYCLASQPSTAARPSPCPQAALRWAEAQVQDEFSDHKRVSWGRAPTFIQRNRLRSQLGWDQADIVLDRQQLDSGQAATLIGLHQLTADFKAGKFSFPELFC